MLPDFPPIVTIISPPGTSEYQLPAAFVSPISSVSMIAIAAPSIGVLSLSLNTVTESRPIFFRSVMTPRSTTDPGLLSPVMRLLYNGASALNLSD